MFKQFKNIDSAFSHIKVFILALIFANVIMFCFYTYRSDQRVDAANDKVLIIHQGKIIPAEVSTRQENLPVELKDHIATFHRLFFSLAPDEKVILTNINKALYLADNTAKYEYDNLQESGFYSSIIAGNVSQNIQVDSIEVNVAVIPYHFTCYATLTIVRTTSKVTRSLVTEGVVRDLEKSDNNPHGFLIEKWKTLENKDLKVETR
jgi:conjugative transposon TraK protein